MSTIILDVPKELKHTIRPEDLRSKNLPASAGRVSRMSINV